MRYLFLLTIMFPLAMIGCGDKSGSAGDASASGSGSQDENGSSASGSTSGARGGSGKTGKDRLIWDNRHLNDWLKDADSQEAGERRAAAKVLGEIGSNAPEELPRIVPVLAKLLKDEKAPVRKYAAESLAKLGPNIKEAVPALGDALQERDTDTRNSALKALTNAGPDAAEALENLKKLLLDEKDRNVRYTIVSIIGQLKCEPEQLLPALKIAMGDKDKNIGEYAVRLTVRVGEPALPELIHWLQDKNDALNVNAAIALATFKEKAKPATPQLRAALYDPDPKFRARAAAALAAIGDPKAIDWLMPKLEDEDVCLAAAAAIITLGPKEDLIDPLVKIVKDGKGGSRGAATNVLVAIGKPAIGPLTDLVILNNEQVLSQVVFFLGKMGPAAKEALPRLLVLLRDNDGNVSLGARTAMEKIDLEEDIVPKLVDIAIDPNGYGGDNAALLLVHPKLRKQGIPKLVELLKLTDDKALDPKALENILQALAKVKPPSDAAPAVEAIVPLLKHEDERVQQEARGALKKIDPETAKKNGVK